MKTTLVFDIGKTNKKVFLFDKHCRQVYESYKQFEEKQDEDGFPCDDLPAIQQWMQTTLQQLLEDEKYDIRAINFSTYGASFVHIDRHGQPVTPLYNYLKPVPSIVLQLFYEKYGERLQIARETASPPLDMLNSGLQLYWLKHTRPEIFRKIRWSLHLPQYLSFLLTGVPVSDFTSIGCHTMLWDFSRNDYHEWVYREEIDRILAPIVDTATSINTGIFQKRVKVGVGIHDSSAALLPYLRASNKPFLLMSTGTWSISLNPFNRELLTDEELENDCLNYMRVDGKPVKAARLFLGEEYKVQIEQLQTFFKVGEDAHQQVAFNEELYEKLFAERRCFKFVHLQTPWEQPENSELQGFASFEEAYHQLMFELAELQVQAAGMAIGNIPIEKIYIDGGFADNEVFVHMLTRAFEQSNLSAADAEDAAAMKIYTTRAALGSALGALVAISPMKIKKVFLNKNYALKKC